MEISITGRHMDVTDALHGYVHEKIEREMADFPRVESVHVILDLEKYRQLAEVVVQAAQHVRVDARETSDDMYVSIDKAIEKAVKQLRRHRDRVQNHKARESLAEAELEVQSLADTHEAGS